MKKIIQIVVLVAMFCATTQIFAQTKSLDFNGWYKTSIINLNEDKTQDGTVFALTKDGYVKGVAILFGDDQVAIEEIPDGKINSKTHFTAILKNDEVFIVAVYSSNGVFSLKDKNLSTIMEINVTKKLPRFITKKCYNRWGYDEKTGDMIKKHYR